MSDPSQESNSSDPPAVEGNALGDSTAEVQATASGGSLAEPLVPYLERKEPQRNEVSLSRELASTSGIGESDVSDSSSGGLASGLVMGVGVVAAVAGAVIVGRSFAATKGSDGGKTGLMQMVREVCVRNAWDCWKDC